VERSFLGETSKNVYTLPQERGQKSQGGISDAAALRVCTVSKNAADTGDTDSCIAVRTLLRKKRVTGRRQKK